MNPTYSRKLGNPFQAGYVNLDRGLKFQRGINDLLKQYEEVHKEMTNKNKQQKLISDFFSKTLIILSKL